MIKPSLKYAVLCCVFLIGLFFVSLNFGSNPLLDIRHFVFDLAVFFLFVFFAVNEFKTYRNEGYLHFFQGISVGLAVFVPAVILFSLALSVIFSAYPELIEGYKAGAKAFLDSKKDIFLEEFSEEQLAEQIKAIDQVTAWQLVASTFGKKLFAGFLVTPVVSIILRKKPK